MEIEISQFSEFFNEYHKRFVRFAKNYVQDEDEAEDIVMDSIIAFWEHRETLPDDVNISAYVLTSIKNRCLNYLQTFRVNNRTSLDELELWKVDLDIKSLKNLDPQVIYTNEIKSIVERTVSKLPKLTRRIFYMSRLRYMGIV